MGGIKRSRSIRKKIAGEEFPQIYMNGNSDFASIKLAPGVESKSYEKDGFVFCEDNDGKIIEIQILNLSELKKRKAA